MLIESRPATDPEIAALVVAQQRELREADGGLDGQVYGRRTTTSTTWPRWSAAGRSPAVALQALDADTGELKRMYVRPGVPGAGHRPAVAGRAGGVAFRQGHSVVCLETGTYLPAAIALYPPCGYEPIPVYGEYVDNPYSVCFAKRLPVAA